MDGSLSAQEQMFILFEVKVQCEQNLSLSQNSGGCAADWDGLVCWPRGFPGAQTKVPCPPYVYDFNHRGYAYRKCDVNGSWVQVESWNKTWSNYSECVRFLQPGTQRRREEFFERLFVLYTTGYAVSFSSLLVAIFIIAYFRRLHCTRNFIHVHLFVSFMLRALSIFIKDSVVHSRTASVLDQDLDQDLLDRTSLAPLDSNQFVGCKLSVLLFVYFLMTNYWWILVEALYLHCLIFMAFSSDARFLCLFTLVGWGVPAVLVSLWALVRGTVADVRCWELSAGNIKWIYQGPILFAIGLNFILFVNIVRVLATKLRETNGGRYDPRKQYRKLSRSTLVLVLVFGVHYIVFVGLPHTEGRGWELRMYLELFFNSFQGFFVSIVYCFCNGEVQSELKKAWRRGALALEWGAPVLCGRYRYGSVVGGLTHSTGSHSPLGLCTRSTSGGRSLRRPASSAPPPAHAGATPPAHAGTTPAHAGATPPAHIRATLPGYVSGSDLSLPDEQRVDDISLKERHARPGPTPEHHRRPRAEAADPEDQSV